MNIDLHTHSQASPDGSLRLEDYRHMLQSGTLDYIAITDHDRIDFAVAAQAALGNQIIIGEEITTQEGEIIGLYLKTPIPPGLSAAETVRRIQIQRGIVYIPHPFETVRKGISLASLNNIATAVNIVETYNGRSLQNRGKLAEQWAQTHHLPGASSSDSHGWHGWGRTYSTVAHKPTYKTLTGLLQDAQHSKRSTGVRGRIYPKFNRLRGHR